MRNQYLLVLALGFVLTATAWCTAAPVSGYVEGKYNTLEKSWEWALSVEKPLGSNLAIGTTMACFAANYGLKGGVVPSWMPDKQLYELWAELRLGDLSLRVSDWCTHTFARAGIGIDDEWDLSVSLRYAF